MKKSKNKLQALLHAKGMSTGELAELAGMGYHSVQKEISGVRKTKHVGSAIAKALGLDFKKMRGLDSDRYLSKFIEKEIDRLQKDIEHRAKLEAARLRVRYLGHDAASVSKAA